MSLGKRLKSALFPEGKLIVTGSMKMSLGCETCPNRKEVIIPSLGELSVGGALRMPWGLAIAMRCDINPGPGGGWVNMPHTGVTVNQEPCAVPCLFEDDIASQYRALSSAPTVLDSQVNPHILTLRNNETSQTE